MVSFFKEKSTATVFGLVLVSASTRAFFWVHPPQFAIAPDDGLIYYLISPLLTLPAILLPLIYQLIVVVQALRLNYAFNEVRMFPKSAFTAALAYILLTALLPAWNNITAALLLNTLLIWLLYKLTKLYNTQQPKTLLFNIGLIAGSTVLLYFPALPLIIVVFFALGILRPFRLNEWLILLLGILTPFYFFAGWLFLNNQLGNIIHQIQIFGPHIVRPANLVLTAVTFAIAGSIIIAGAFMWQSNSGRMVIQVRKTWSFFFVAIVLLAAVVFLVKDAWPNALLLSAVPAAAFVSNTFLYPKRNFVPAIIFWLLVGLIIYNNWFAVKI
ncbi:MAG TPA: hypothetical protein PLA68_05955 [Panacibacter sp.]|nr:hypothetical protein [Panacibacter sp.]